MMISVENLTKKFGRFRAVNNLTFHVHAGEALALWGPNGAGKTTAIRCVLGLIRCKGNLLIGGISAHKYGKATRRLLGYVPQELALHDDLTALDALHFYARLKKAAGDRPPIVLAEVGLAEHGRKRVRELSGGMKQRLALAIALLADPPLLVLDELTANLDADARHGFLTLLANLKQMGKTILFTSHRLDEIELLADRVLVLVEGARRMECAPRELAGALGMRSTMKLFVGEDLIGTAVDQLRLRGFTAMPNGSGLHVEVSPCQKGLPIRALAEVSIFVRDFEFVSELAHSNQEGASHE